MWVTEGTYDAKAPIETLWSVYADVACWSRWADDIVWARLEGPFQAGSSGRIRYRGTPPLRFKVVSVEAPRSYITEVPLPLARLTFDHRLTGTEDGTRIVERLRAAYAAISRGDIDAALAALPLHPDVELLEPPQFVAGGHYRGADEAERYFRRSRAAWEELELVPETFLDAGERVVVLLRA